MERPMLTAWIKAGLALGQNVYIGNMGNTAIGHPALPNDGAACYVIADLLRPDRALAWQFTDWKVTSVTGGSLWFRRTA